MDLVNPAEIVLVGRVVEGERRTNSTSLALLSRQIHSLIRCSLSQKQTKKSVPHVT